jgi:endonuclease/exonuclease/phosphatase family metal-dependent hydrolase
MGEEARTKSIQLILDKISEINHKNYPVIFMGDFNSEPDSQRILSLKKLMNDSRDITEEKPFGPNGTFNGFNHDVAVPKLIDYIFLSKDSKLIVMKYAILSDSKDLKYPSDHFPVFVKLNYNK